MTAVLLALASAAFFGAMTVATRLGLAGQDAAAGALATVLWALPVTLVASAFRFDLHGAWPFLLAGMLSPGVSQVLFTLAVREVGASRTSVTVGSAPLVAGAIALVFLGEPLRAPLVFGAIAIVAGGLLLAAERGRPSDLRARGLLFAAMATVAFATRDALIRALHGHASPEVAGAATLLTGALVAAAWTRRPPGRTLAVRMAPAGILFGLSYICVFEAYFRGRVTLVSPLVATESLWGVGLSALVFSKEAVGRRLLLGAASVVIGGVVIGAFR